MYKGLDYTLMGGLGLFVLGVAGGGGEDVLREGVRFERCGGLFCCYCCCWLFWD